MFLAQLFEAIDKRHASFCFGRMNPPTVGHAQVINTVAKSAQGGDYFVFVSQSQDPKKNPLDYATKVKFIKAMFAEQAGHVVYDPSLKTIIQIAHWLYAKGYRSITMVAGSDRLEDFKELLEKYNGVQGANGYYQFDSINFVSSGDRDPDAEGLAGVSATAAREAAKAGNLQAFAQATGAGELAEPLFHAVRKGLLVESTDRVAKLTHEIEQLKKMISNPRGRGVASMRKHLDQLYKELEKARSVSEDASGYIPKNKKEAKDPRWSNALSVDVTPKTPYKNAKALKLV